MELKAEHVKNIRSLAVCKDFLRQAIELNDQLNEELAKLNRQVEFLKTTHSSCNDCNKCADGMGRVFDKSLDELKKEKAYLLEHTTEVINSQECEIHRQKYKRCLAMARYCRSVWCSIIFIHEGNGAGRHMKWEQRWLKIAKQFKELETYADNLRKSYGRPNLFVYCKDTCDPRGLYYAKNEVDKVIDDMMAEARTDNSAG